MIGMSIPSRHLMWLSGLSLIHIYFKTDRKTLIQKIYAVYDATVISGPKLESGDEIIDIDPFTIFGTFNKMCIRDSHSP